MPTFTAEELAQHNGETLPTIYVSLKGKVYDCTSAANFYGPGKGYAAFSGKEVSRCLGKMMLTTEEANSSWANLSETNMKTLDEWVAKYEAKYKVVGEFKPDADFEKRGNAFEP
ncbi:membrane-associated progesterone binding protein 2 [Strigomonas culicis]|uniref:Membrane-associated progesterone binding protein 2 n=1 Tax=Strigomonas culicis TaxID=28005 RepID=S9VKJ2_9TRYP|nr:membrane-associated progesterone binding protein 2 [Strigomonas culicis]EPY30912.1 membrane-associated progesterone binding protein 2 [Strigomonas culicis]|eukprot:EPY23725.1 membrane-associated progesterone binding protein 2 [Strigomonas culicis]